MAEVGCITQDDAAQRKRDSFANSFLLFADGALYLNATYCAVGHDIQALAEQQVVAEFIRRITLCQEVHVKIQVLSMGAVARGCINHVAAFMKNMVPSVIPRLCESRIT
jgi:hypothetical protein